MVWGIKLGRVVETPFGQISDATLRAGIGKYQLQAMLLLVSVMTGKGFYLIGLFAASIAVALYYQWPLSRYLAWRKPWFKHYFYAHLAASLLVGGLLSTGDYAGWGFLWVLLNIVFTFALMSHLSDDIEELMQGRVDFLGIEKRGDIKSPEET